MASAKERGRARLDSSLMSPILSQRDGIAQIVRDQLARRPALARSPRAPGGVTDEQYHAWSQETADRATERRSSEILTFLDALRSARQELLDNENEEAPFSWKIKEETDVMRVMYRPGPEGTPFHTYCVEGVINGPMVNAVCVAWEAPAFPTWWPQFNMPTFKVVESKWVKRVCVGEDLSHIRVKVPWPFAAREVLMTEFELEHFEDDVVIVVFGTAPSDPDEGEKEIFGFSAEELPPATHNVVRMDVSGGFMLQRMTNEQSFFRTLVNLDVKLDFVPPWVINFITRQLVGSGYKLYQKAVLSASEPVGRGEVFQRLLSSEPLYRRIQSGAALIDGQKRQRKAISDTVDEERPEASTSQELVEGFRVEKRATASEEKAIHIDAEVERALQVLDKIIELVEEWKSETALDGFPGSTPVENGDLVQESASPALSRSTINKNLSNGSSVEAASPRQRSWPRLALLKRVLKGKFKRKGEL